MSARHRHLNKRKSLEVLRALREADLKAKAGKPRISFKEFKCCTRKVAYQFHFEAVHKGMIIYRCPYCKKFHRASKKKRTS